MEGCHWSPGLCSGAAICHCPPECLQESHMLFSILGICYYSIVWRVPYCEYIIVCSAIFLVNTRVVFRFQLLWRKLTWTLSYVSFTEPMYSFLWGIYLGGVLLGHRVDKCLALIKLPALCESCQYLLK